MFSVLCLAFVILVNYSVIDFSETVGEITKQSEIACVNASFYIRRARRLEETNVCFWSVPGSLNVKV